MSQMNLLMMEDFPTAWSPRKTILYLRRGGIVPFERFKLLMFVILQIIQTNRKFLTKYFFRSIMKVAVGKNNQIRQLDGQIKTYFNEFRQLFQGPPKQLRCNNGQHQVYSNFCEHELQSYLIMQLRLSNGSQVPFNANVIHNPRKHKQQAIFTYHNRDFPPKNVYYDTNPYFLHLSPSEPYIKNLVATSRNSSHSRQCTDTASQRSCKVVRANGLRVVEKPKIGRIPQQSPGSSARMNEQARRFMQRELQLETKNKILKGQNEYLKDKLRQMQDTKNHQISALEQKIGRLQQLTETLERKMQDSEAEWRQQVRKLRQSQINDVE